jgi:hypothetical protein
LINQNYEKFVFLLRLPNECRAADIASPQFVEDAFSAALAHLKNTPYGETNERPEPVRASSEWKGTYR